ncbi:hypothetical protein EKH55_0090 [Sinorhizobium alkalisoli]|nr:hypothetical protein EKH55_0090 [Sinorhizobium alkalisoli]
MARAGATATMKAAAATTHELAIGIWDFVRFIDVTSIVVKG